MPDFWGRETLKEKAERESRELEQSKLGGFLRGILPTPPTLRKRKEFLRMPSTRSVKGQGRRSKAAWKRRRTRRR